MSEEERINCVGCGSRDEGLHAPACPSLKFNSGIGNYQYIGLFTCVPAASRGDQPKVVGVSQCGICQALVIGTLAQEHEDWHVELSNRMGEIQKRRIKLRKRTK